MEMRWLPSFPLILIVGLLTGCGGEPEIQVVLSDGYHFQSGEITSFDKTAPGSARSLNFIIKNTGGSALRGLTPKVTGKNANDFMITKNPDSSVAPGRSTLFTVEFRPAAGGLKVATVLLASNDTDENPFHVLLAGDATGPGSGRMAPR